MIGYTMLGTNNFDKALDFYDGLMGTLNGKRVMETENGQLYGFAQGALFGISKPYDGKSANNGNGTMIAFNAGSQEKVQTTHAKALELGGTCEGEPGPRGEGGFYGAYFRDLDGNKLCAYTMG